MLSCAMEMRLKKCGKPLLDTFLFLGGSSEWFAHVVKEVVLDEIC